MSELTIRSFELTRGFTLKHLENMNREMADKQPEGFNNNIRWHVGHVLTTAEQIMFGYPEKSSHLPANYGDLFNRGTSPADWKGEVPSIEELTELLKSQLERIRHIPVERLGKKLEKPFFFDINTFGELTNFAIFHESYHLGQIHIMKRMIENEAVNKS